MAAALHVGEVGQGLVEVAAALLEVAAAYVDLLDEVVQLAGLAGLLVVHVDDRGDLVEGEAEPPPAQDQRQPDAVALAEDPAVPRRSGESRPTSS